MSREPDPRPKGGGYGNIYTPSAGAMIIHVQRESGLANRTLVLTRRQVRLLKRGAYAAAAILLLVLLSWFYLATQAARVPLLQSRLQGLQQDVGRLDTLQRALNSLEGRFQQVQKMLGASAPASPATATNGATVAMPALQWPVAVANSVVAGPAAAEVRRGVAIAVPAATPVRAAGPGIVVEVGSDPRGAELVRVEHAGGYESIYANLSAIRVARGDRVAQGAELALSGGARGALPPHLRFEIRRGGADVNPTSLMKQGPANGDLQQR